MKLIYISGEDYSALQFEDAFKGTPVQDIIDNPSKFEYNEETSDEDAYWELEIHDVGEVSDNFIKFVRGNIQDYDDSKSKNFWLENEII